MLQDAIRKHVYITTKSPRFNQIKIYVTYGWEDVKRMRRKVSESFPTLGNNKERPQWQSVADTQTHERKLLGASQHRNMHLKIWSWAKQHHESWELRRVSQYHRSISSSFTEVDFLFLTLLTEPHAENVKLRKFLPSLDNFSRNICLGNICQENIFGLFLSRIFSVECFSERGKSHGHQSYGGWAWTIADWLKGYWGKLNKEDKVEGLLCK